MKMKFVRVFAACAAAGLAFTSLGETSADGTEKPAAATALTSQKGTITSTSGSFNSGPAAAFANDGTSRMLKQSKALNIMYTFGEPTVVNCYGIKAGGSYFEAARGPKTWKIYGSNDYDPQTKNNAEANWVELDSRGQGDRCAETGWASGDYRFYSFANSTAYATYKIDVTDNNNHSYTQWQYMEYCYMKAGGATITVDEVPGGTVEGVPSSCQIGDPVTLTAIPAAGNKFRGWRNVTEGTVAFDNPWTFVVKDDVEIEPVFCAIGSDVRYVSTTGSDDGAGSEESPFQTPAKAFADLAGLGGTICIAPGEYVLQEELSLAGPYTLCGTGADPSETVLKGRATSYTYGISARVLSISNPRAVVENLTVARGLMAVGSGNNNYGGGIYMTGGMVTNCVIRDCYTRQASEPIPRGGGVYLDGDNALVTHCTISGCSVYANAGWIGQCGAGAHIAKGRIENTLVIDCHTHSDIASPGAGNVIGGIQLDGGAAVNCTVVNCYGSHTGGIYAPGQAAQAVNCVSFNCTKKCKNADGVLETTVCPFAGSAEKFYNCASDATETYGQNDSVLNLTATAFADYSGGNFMPIRGSALYDAGKALASYPSVDLAGRDRIMGARIDIGCYEGLDDAMMTIVGNPENYGTSEPSYGLHEDLKGEVSLTVTERVLSEDGRTAITCVGWKLYQVNDAGQFVQIDEGVGNTAKITMPSGTSRFEWEFHKQFKMVVIEGAGLGDMTCDEWVDEGDEFSPVATPEEGWKFSGWIGTIDPSESMSETFIADGPKDIGATFLPEGYDSPVQYVSMTGDDANDGFTLGTARKTVAVALGEVAKYRERGGKVFIDKGEYENNVNVANYNGLPLEYPIQVIGMTGNPEDVVVKRTGYPGRVFLMNDPEARIESLTMKGGSHSGQVKGIGCMIDTKGGTVSNCIVKSCTVTGYSCTGGIHVGSGKGFVTHTVVDDCTTGDENAWGGTKAAGIQLATSGARAENCLVSNCRTTTKTLNGDKKAMCVGGIFVAGGCSAKNCTVIACKGTRSGGIMADGATAVVQNCVVIDCDYVSDASLEAVNLGQKDWVGTAAAFDHCATDNATAINDTCFGGLAASAFKDYAQGNYTPKSGGPLTDKGVTPEGWADLVDLAGKPRVIGKTIDIGCYEGNSAGLILNIK